MNFLPNAQRKAEETKKTMAISLLAVLMLWGCTSTQEEYIARHPELSPPVREAILAGEVVPGMTMAEVRASWGAPDYERSRNLPGGKTEVTWQWGTILLTRDSQGHVRPEQTRVISDRTVVFNDGVVIDYYVKR